uniref:hypothetical protein n=1 Tax=Winogradskyella poriferorum TaxID=307627 RepID=UPI003D64AC0A
MKISIRFSDRNFVLALILALSFISISSLNAQCSITDITSSNESGCNDNGTPSNINDDTFTADITVLFTNVPATGTLDLSGDGSASVSVVGLTSPHTFVGVTLPANGSDISLTATFSDDTGCTLTNNGVTTAPFECSDDACLDIVPPGNPTAALTSSDVTFDVTNANDPSSPAILNSVTIAGQPNPFTGIARPESTSYQFANEDGANQFIVEQQTTINDISEGPAIFDPALIEANSSPNLRKYLSLDNGIESTDYVQFIYNSEITSASNRYVVITERAGNNEMTVQALDGSLNLIGNVVNISTTDYIDTSVVEFFPSFNVEVVIYPLTALVPFGTDIKGIRVTQSGATGDDGGDGKAFILYDPAFYIPPPTIEATSVLNRPTCPTNLGSISVDATDNGGGAIEYSLTSLSGTNDQPWQSSNTFNNLPPDTYTISVRYQSSPICEATSTNDVVFLESGFNITSISASDITSCNNNGTPEDPTDDTFTADITVIFDKAPTTGTLDISGEGNTTVAVGSLDSATSHTFNDVILPATGNDIELTATFSDDNSCTLTNSAVTTAPLECSDDSCLDIVPGGNPTAALISSDVTFDVTNANDPSSPAILNSVTIAGQPNPFTGIARPESTSYQFANEDGANQFIVEQQTTINDISEGPAIFDPALIEANSSPNLRKYLSLDNGIESTDYVQFIYNSEITSASNRYVVITERAGNNEMTVQALDGSLNLIGNVVNISTTDYIDTSVVEFFPSFNVEVVIYPLTALVPFGTDIKGIRVTQSGATGDDGGDGKAFILYDPAFYIPPPTIEATSVLNRPTCPTNLGSISVDATDNGGGAIEYSLTSLSGTNDQPWQSSNTFNNLPPDTYSPVVRYQTTPSCVAVSSNPVILNFIECPSIEAVKTVAITNDVAPV